MKKIFDRMFGQYKGLRRELYVLFWGKAATNMGAMIWPMLTLILSNKLGMSAEEIARITIAMGIIQFPANLLGGKLADHCNKKNLIVVCDLVTVTCYLTAAFLPVSMTQIMLFFTAGVFQTMENPSYDALVADLSTAENREKAYSLIYLGLNLGLILAPSIGGILFQHHLGLAYAIDGLTTLSSTILILLFIKDIAPVKEEKNIYEEAKDTQSTWKILSGQKVILLFLICWAVYQFSYAQFNFLIPLNMERSVRRTGSCVFWVDDQFKRSCGYCGNTTSHKMGSRTWGYHKTFGRTDILVSISLSMYIFIQGIVPLYYVSMILFTIGEVMTTLGSYPYLTRRIPASHRGRISSVSNIFLGAAMYYSQWKIGAVLETHTIMTAWQCVAAAGVLGLILYLVLIKADRKVYPLLYKK